MKVLLHLVYRENQKKNTKKESFVAHLWRRTTIPALPEKGSTIQFSLSKFGEEESIPVTGVDYYLDESEDKGGILIPIIRLEISLDDAGDVETTLDAWRNDREKLFEEDNLPFLTSMGFARGTTWTYLCECDK